MNLITCLSCLSVLSLCIWGRRSPDARAALTALVIAGCLFAFFAGFLLAGIFAIGSLGYLLMVTGAFGLAIGVPTMHLGAPASP
jgi:hypothetical protein